MTTMNILSCALIALIVASGIALFFGIRAAQANEITAPTFEVPASQPVFITVDAMNDMPAEGVE